jgi:hypothetical protein
MRLLGKSPRNIHGRKKIHPGVAAKVRGEKKIRATDAKEVGMGNPAEKTCCRPEKKASRKS